MKKKDIQELKHRTPDEFARLVQESSEKLRQLKFDLAAGKVKDITGIRDLRKSLARMKTFIGERERERNQS